jgi:AcrR family transcriptional regulator
MPRNQSPSLDPGASPGSLAEETDSLRTTASARVMEAGVLRFSEIGFMATTIRDITSMCGLTPAAFYNHFESKEALLYTIVSEANSALERRFAKWDASTLTPEKALSELVRILVTFNITYPREARIANREYVFLQESTRQQVIDHRRRVRVMFEKVLSSGKTSGGLVDTKRNGAPSKLEVRFLAISILNVSIDSSEWFHAAGPLSVSEFADTYCRLAVRMAGFDRAGR